MSFMTEFALTATTAGDELISPKTIIVATSQKREHLQMLAAQRKAEREKWTAENPDFPWWTKAGLIVEEKIEEISLV
jgi:hypothetical protein